MNIIGMLCVLLGLLFVREGRGENKKREVGKSCNVMARIYLILIPPYIIIGIEIGNKKDTVNALSSPSLL